MIYFQAIILFLALTSTISFLLTVTEFFIDKKKKDVRVNIIASFLWALFYLLNQL